jgi:hypothetical protein
LNSSEERKNQAIAAIRNAFDSTKGEDSVAHFITHHLQEVPSAYWRDHCGSESPEPREVLNLLELRSSWGEDDIEYFDFTLPADVTNYVISVHFDETGEIDVISMES